MRPECGGGEQGGGARKEERGRRSEGGGAREEERGRRSEGGGAREEERGRRAAWREKASGSVSHETSHWAIAQLEW